MRQCPTCNRPCEDAWAFCPTDGSSLFEVTMQSGPSTSIPLEFTESEQIITLHKDSVSFRIRKTAREVFIRMATGNYNANLWSARMWVEIQKSRELLRGFSGKRSGKDLCEFLEENFTREEFNQIFAMIELDFKVSKPIDKDAEAAFKAQESDALLNIEIAISGVFINLIKRLRELER